MLQNISLMIVCIRIDWTSYIGDYKYNNTFGIENIILYDLE